MLRRPILWQRHQSRILVTNLIQTPDVVNESTHLMKVSKIRCLEVMKKIKFCKACHGITYFNQCLRKLRIHECTEVCYVDICKFIDFIHSLFAQKPYPCSF